MSSKTSVLKFMNIFMRNLRWNSLSLLSSYIIFVAPVKPINTNMLPFMLNGMWIFHFQSSSCNECDTKNVSTALRNSEVKILFLNYLDIIFPSLLELLEPEVSFAGIEGRWRGDAGAFLTVGSCGHCLHSVEILKLSSPFFNTLAGAPTQRPDYTFTAAIWALWESLHFVIVT